MVLFSLRQLYLSFYRKIVVKCFEIANFVANVKKPMTAVTYEWAK